jgi:hypothetical protein
MRINIMIGYRRCDDYRRGLVYGQALPPQAALSGPVEVRGILWVLGIFTEGILEHCQAPE